MADALLELLPADGTFNNVLDIGSATGRVARELTLRLPSSRVIALDLSLPMLLKAKENALHGGIDNAVDGNAGDGSFSAVLSDFEALPFLDGSIDLVLSNLTYQWSNDLSGAFKELFAALAPGAVVLINTLTRGTLNELLESFREAEEGLSRKKKRPFISFVEPSILKRAIEGSGLTLTLFEERTNEVEYFDMWELLRVLKLIGAANPLPAQSDSLAMGSLLRSAASIYKSRFSLKAADGSACDAVGATYNTVFFMARKPG